VIDLFYRLTPSRYALAAGAALFACGAPPSTQVPSKSASLGRCRYDARLVSQAPAELEVTVECEGNGLVGLTLEAEPLAGYVHGIQDLSRPDHPALTPSGHSFLLEKPADTLKVAYKVDLEGMARDTGDFDQALRVGESLVAPVSSWMLYPEPLKVGVPVTLHVHDTPGFATGLRRGVTPGTYVLEAHEIPVATYSVFGEFQKRELKVGPAGAPLTLAVLDGPLDSDLATLEHWVSDAAAAVSTFWGRFPDDQALVTIVPQRGRKGVIFGKILPESAPGVLIEMGEHTSREELYEDWILVHELFHIGSPSFYREGKWLDEGLATYFEPIIRARAGWIDEETVWTEFMRSMPQGLSAINRKGLEYGESYRDIYWGGAIYCLLADLEIREKTGGRFGLEQGLRAVLQAGGNSSEVWSLSQVFKVADAAVGAPILLNLANTHAYAVTPVNLDALWARLGVVRTERGAKLDDQAPLALLRRSIVQGVTQSSVAKR
jgi:hypothetical protein